MKGNFTRLLCVGFLQGVLERKYWLETIGLSMQGALVPSRYLFYISALPLLRCYNTSSMLT